MSMVNTYVTFISTGDQTYESTITFVDVYEPSQDRVEILCLVVVFDTLNKIFSF